MPLREFLRYLAASAAALALDTAAFTLALRFGAGLAAAACVGFILGLVLIYCLSTRLVFSQRRLVDRRSEFALFACVGVAGLLLTQALLWLLVSRLGTDPLVAKLASACGVFLFNFCLRKVLLFTTRGTAFSMAS